jgi:hypothetical protein
VNNLTAIVREAINLAIPSVKSKNSTFPHWFYNSLKYDESSTLQRIQEIQI